MSCCRIQRTRAMEPTPHQCMHLHMLHTLQHVDVAGLRATYPCDNAQNTPTLPLCEEMLQNTRDLHHLSVGSGRNPIVRMSMSDGISSQAKVRRLFTKTFFHCKFRISLLRNRLIRPRHMHDFTRALGDLFCDVPGDAIPDGHR